jgi:PAS domain S-box-containing protein
MLQNSRQEKVSQEETTALTVSEKELLENAAFVQQILDTSPAMVIVIDILFNKLVYINKTSENLLGYSAGEAALLKREEMVHPNDLENWLRFYNEVAQLTDGAVCEHEYRVKTKKGNYIWVSNKSTVFKRDEKGVAWLILSISTDITAKKFAERKLFESDVFIETLVDANIDRLMAYDRNMNVVAWNERCEEVYGIKKEEILGKPFFNFFPKIKETEALINALERSMNGETVHIPIHPNIYTKEYSELFYTPLKDANNNVTGVLTIIHDLTERIESENELMELNNSLQAKNKELETLNEELSTFAFVASHDLGEPLRKIQIFSDRILKTEKDNLSAAGKDNFHRVLKAVTRMNNLLNDVLSFSRLSSTKDFKKKHSLNEVLDLVKKELADAISETDAIIESDYLPVLKCNKSHMILLFQNFISNALKYQKKGNRPAIKIKYEIFGAAEIDHPLAIHATHHRISFYDNGIGFEIEYAEKIFQMFQRLHAISEYPGTGIGLAICKKVMETHKGFIKVESTLGVGSVFHCYFPDED